jgi:hypothetical protein
VSDALIRENVAVAQQNAAGYWYGGRGGGVAVLHGQGEMRNATITGNRAREGGGYYNYGFSARFNVTVSLNGASLSGGGARNYAGQMWIKDGTIVNNETTPSWWRGQRARMPAAMTSSSTRPAPTEA